MDDICEEAIAEAEFSSIFLLYIKILTYRFIDLSPLIWINENL